MAKEMPFDDDVMTLIMGIDAEDAPGQHGRVLAPPPDKDAITLITQIRDLCDDYLMSAGKRDGKDKGDEKGSEKSEKDAGEAFDDDEDKE